MAFSIVQGEPTTGISNPATLAQPGPTRQSDAMIGSPKPAAPQEGGGTPIFGYGGLAGTPGANPTANYRRFDMDGGEGSMGHHWAGVERGQE